MSDSPTRNTQHATRWRSTVKSWNEALRYGYIAHPEDYSLDVYANAREVPLREGKGLAKLSVGEAVEFEIEAGERGPVARRISFPSATPHSAPPTPHL